MEPGTEYRFSIDASIFPPYEQGKLAQTISDQGCAQVGPGTVNTMLDRMGMIIVIVTPGRNWLAAMGFEAAVKHWLATR